MSASRPVHPESLVPVVWNVKASHLRPRFKNLLEWMRSSDNVYIGRAVEIVDNDKRYPVPASVFANPFKIGRDGDRDDVIRKFESYIAVRLVEEPELKEALRALAGKNVGCWCVDSPTSSCDIGLVCHGQVLARLCREEVKANKQKLRAASARAQKLN